MAVYSHRQQGRILRLIILAGSVITFIALFLASPNVDLRLIGICLIAAGGIYALAMQLTNLTTMVDDESLRWWFGSGIWKKSVQLTDIASAEPVVNKWWWGWGIRYYGKGWLYCVSGLQAVEIVLKSGKHIRIGTDDPHGLAEALAGRLAAPGSRR
ncbi:MAG: hypothetical protein HKN11_17445 [Rhizobiales bacterium]|nr:hypothetical protein [Hyphomicrobiales bacterium]